MPKKPYKKIHKKVDGQMLHVNKRFSDLKLSQKEFITETLRKFYLENITEDGFLSSAAKEEILNKTMWVLGERQMNIGYGPVKQRFSQMIPRFRKSYFKSLKKNNTTGTSLSDKETKEAEQEL